MCVCACVRACVCVCVSTCTHAVCICNILLLPDTQPPGSDGGSLSLSLPLPTSDWQCWCGPCASRLHCTSTTQHHCPGVPLLPTPSYWVCTCTCTLCTGTKVTLLVAHTKLLRFAITEHTIKCIQKVTSSGFAYLAVHTLPLSMSQPALSWKDASSLDIACALTRSEKESRGHHKQNFSFIHVRHAIHNHTKYSI